MQMTHPSGKVQERTPVVARARAAVSEYFSSRLSGRAPLPVVFWRDMILIGTCLAFFSVGLMLIAAVNGAPTWVIVGVYVVNWPYSGFVVMAVWKAAAWSTPGTRVVSRAVALVWLALSVLV
jgi:hypothetical protein